MSCADYNGSTYLTGTLPAAQPFTAMAWVRLSTFSTTSGAYTPYFLGAQETMVGVHNSLWAYGSTNVDTDSAVAVVANTWYFVCVVRNGNTHEIWINAPSTADISQSNADTSTSFFVGGAAGGTLIMTGQLGPVFVYTAALTGPEIRAQYRGGRKPVRHANIWFWNSAMVGTAHNVDQSGVGGNLTVAAGTLANSSEDPGVPWTRRRAIWMPPPTLDQNASASQLSPGSTLQAPSAAPGTVTGTAPQLSPGVTFPAPTAAAPITATASVLAPGVIFPAPSADSAITVAPPVLSPGSTFLAPTASPGAVSASPDVVVSAASFGAPTASPGAVTAAAPVLTGAASFGAPIGAVDGGDQAAAPSVFAPGATFPATTGSGSITASAPVLIASASFPAPSGTPGTVSALPGLVTAATTFLAPTVSSTDQNAGPPVLAAGSTFSRPSLTGGISFHGAVTVVSSERRYSIRSVRLLPEGE